MKTHPVSGGSKTANSPSNRYLMRNVLKVHPRDNVLVALRDLEAGATVGTGPDQIPLKQAVPAKHKIALHTIPPGERVHMYGISVALTTELSPAGGLFTRGHVKMATLEWRGMSVSRGA